MKPGIKPPHLWNWTPRKWFESVLNDRLSLKLDQRNKEEQVKTSLIVMSLSLFFMYSFGLLDPKDIITKILKERSCDSSPQNVEPEPAPAPKVKPQEPHVCPPKKKKELPKCP
ncbi:unnamed protein product [Pieris macdunnoughi]|uniref:Uncharacterized protein n=1 Tax=Pieris macdunnoughi TaxID=345717 RepID=A0A821U1V8_9NEOP|nr:unnamed protein product [Pieris macdunnoughi]